MSVSVSEFGRLPSGETVSVYTITKPSGASAALLDYGATWQKMLVPNRSGELVDVVLGYDTIEGYLENKMYLGATVGRVANRIKNARFSLNGTEYKLAANDGDACLHGGIVGYDKKIWKTQIDDDSVIFTLTSPDGDEGFPGELSVAVVYSLGDDNALSIRYLLNTDRDTIHNMTNHAYFNLAGHTGGTILEQTLQVDADRFTRITEEILPTGEFAPVEGTPIDFRKAKPLGQDIDADAELVHTIGGFDHNFVLNHPKGGVEHVATAADPIGGVVMDVYTDQPGMQLFTPIDFSNMTGKGGEKYGPHPAFCLETQHFGNSMDNPQFPSIVLRAGEVFSSETIYHFQVAK